MTDDAIEKVARAISRSNMEWPATDSAEQLEAAVNKFWRDHIEEAKAAISAARPAIEAETLEVVYRVFEDMFIFHDDNVSAFKDRVKQELGAADDRKADWVRKAQNDGIASLIDEARKEAQVEVFEAVERVMGEEFRWSARLDGLLHDGGTPVEFLDHIKQELEASSDG